MPTEPESPALPVRQVRERRYKRRYMIEDYNKARKKGERDYRRAIAQGRYPYLPALDDFLETSRQQNQIPLGVCEIPLSMIAGTKTAGRQNAFANSFMPLLSEKTEFARKWASLFDSQINEGLRDPILAYEYMNRFYVQEGNKRVSVLRFLGASAISADVIRVMPEKSSETDVEIYYEFVEFYEAVKLNEILFSAKGRYAELAKILGRDLKTPWPEEAREALRSAFDLFAGIFEAKNGGRLGITSGDAFLFYLRIFSLDSLLNEPKERVSSRIEKVWTEFLTGKTKDSIELMEDPADSELLSSTANIRKMFAFMPVYTEDHPLKAAFLYEKKPEESRWVYGHELGRSEIEEKFDGLVRTLKYEDLSTDTAVGAAILDAEKKGCEVIFTTSASMMPAALRVAIDRPGLKILNCSIHLSHNKVRTYYSRMYEAKFLMGVLAASLTDSERIGYVADYPFYGTIANVNAFAIGAALIKPQVKIALKWSSQKGVDWRQEFTWEGISVISGPDFIRPGSEEREYGLYYNKDGSFARLAAPIWQWGRYYELILRTVLAGTYSAQLPRPDQAINYWYGMASGVVDVILSKNLSYYSDKLMEILRREIISGDLLPFEGELRDQDGNLRSTAKTLLTSDEIIRMDWLNDNVLGEIPPSWKLPDSAKKALEIVGVKEAVE